MLKVNIDVAESLPRDVTNLRRSSRLSDKIPEPGKRANKSGAVEDQEEFYSSCKPHDICKVGRHVKLNVASPAPDLVHILDGCATLTMQDYALQNSQDWRAWRLLKYVEAVRVRVSGFRYYITFEAEDGHGVRHTFETDVWDSVRLGRRVNGFRTLKPQSKWYSGNLWIPLTRSTSYTGPISLPPSLAPASNAIYFPKPKNTRLVPPKRMGEDSRNMYNKKRAKKSDEDVALGSPVNLKLDELSEKDTVIPNDCATLAMHDHLIQTLNMKWQDWQLTKIETAYMWKSVSGYTYSLIFQIEHEDSARTLEAEVCNGMDQRRVSRLRAIKPEITECYPGNLWIPI